MFLCNFYEYIYDYIYEYQSSLKKFADHSKNE